MTYQVRLADGHSFTALQDASILQSAHIAGVLLEHSCDTGRCGSCRTRMLSGSVKTLKDTSGLTPSEQGSGWILTCAHAPASDIHLDTAALGAGPTAVARTFPARIASLDLLAPDVIRTRLRLPPSADFRFRAGQHIELIGPGGTQRLYSIANPPGADQHVELHIRRVADGVLSRYWFNEARPHDLLRLRGPLGSFSLRLLAGLHLVLLATGTGVAPILSMLGELAQRPSEEQPLSSTLYWGGRVADDLYAGPQLGSHPALRFVPVLSRTHQVWSGPRGHVQDVLLAERANLTQTVVYACGSAPMILDARAALAAQGLPEGRFHADAFVSSA
jgi:CDP-4-dehydro-6-deoxyglucose reductase